MPAQHGFGRGVERLIGAAIHSVGDLDLLLKLHREPDRAWAPGDLSAELSCPEPWARMRLAHLRAQGLVARRADGRFVFAGGSPSRTAVEQLAQLAEHRRGDVARAIFALRPRGG